MQRSGQQIQRDIIFRIGTERVTEMTLRISVSPQLMTLHPEADMRRQKPIRVHFLMPRYCRTSS